MNKLCTINLLLQTAEQDAYDFFTSAIDGDVLDHFPLPCRNLTTTNEIRGQGVPPTAAGVELTVEREEERDDANEVTTALLGPVHTHYIPQSSA